jgi:hypothetical protein
MESPEVLKGFISFPKRKVMKPEVKDIPLTQVPQVQEVPKKRGRKPKSLMTFTIERGNFIVRMD